MLDMVSVPSNRRFIQIDVHLLGLEIFVDSMDPQFPTKARLLETAPGGFHVSGLHVIHPDDSSTDGFDHAQGAIDVSRPDGSGQSEGSVVGNLERVTLVLEGNYRGHRAKDFFPRNAR
jgi:hypothetical protein